jgi:lipid-A-disaccharide synthase
MRLCCATLRTYHPDAVILVDYPGFNLKIAKFVKRELGIPVFYYISPKVWAWKHYRIRTLRRYVDRLFCILPFEESFFSKYNYHVDYVGNPSVDTVSAYWRERQELPDTFLNDNKLLSKPILAILSGSRRQEIRQNLPTLSAVAAIFHTNFEIVIAGAPGLTLADYTPYIKGDIPVIFGQTYALLSHSFAALVTSGTATLETALFRVPQVVCYYWGGGQMANFIFRHFFQTPYISLVNLIAGREVVKELFGADFTHDRVLRELKLILNDPEYRAAMLRGYDEVIQILGAAGASERVAQEIYAHLSPKCAIPSQSNITSPDAEHLLSTL